MGKADIISTGRIEALVYPVMAEITLGGSLSFTVKMNGMVRAHIDAKLTPGAFLLVKNDDPVFPFRDPFNRAGFGADGFGTVFADIHTPDEIELPVHELGTIRPNRQILHPVARIDRIIFLFACDFTGLASPAGVLFDDQRISIHG